MAVKYPTVEEVKQAFADAIPSGEPFDQGRWDELYRAVLDPTWQPASECIEVLQANGARLVRVLWEFAINKMNTSSEAALRSSAAGLRQELSILVNSEPASFDTLKTDTKDGPATMLRCWMVGIIG